MTMPGSVFPRLAAASLAVAMLSSCHQGKSPASNEAQGNAVESKYPDWAGGAPPPVPAGVVDPRAVDALKGMSRYLMSLNGFKLDTSGSLDVVTADGQRVQVDGQANYKVKRPGMAIHYVSDLKNRDFYYDGKQFTVYSPALGFYATVPAPATNRELLDLIYNKYGIKLPLEDLFRWNDTGQARIDDFKSAADLGPSMQDGVQTTHYAFREPEVDWEVWIKDGAQPLPVKLSIVDRTDPARPAFTTRLKWTVNPPLSDADFRYTPGPDAKRIQLAQFERQ